ncbi:MAG TPA: hypothetical protein VK447_13115, partial [Myxococcaceae bacterium]|nr:hypothetical protein [Myxococcaceae bacterium]
RSAVLRGGTSYLVLSGNADNGNLPKALSAVKEALVSFGKDGVTPTELDRARWALLNRYSVSHGSSYSLVNDILDTRNMGWSLESIDRYPERLLGVTAAELQRSFASCAASRQVLSVVGDEPTVNAAVTGVW